MSPSPTKSPKSPLLKLLLSSKTSLSSRSSNTPHSPLFSNMKNDVQNRSPLQFKPNYFQEKLQEPTIKNLRYILSMTKDEPYIEQIISSLFKDERYKTLSSNPEQLIKLIVGDIWNTCHVLQNQCFPAPNKSRFTFKKPGLYLDNIQRVTTDTTVVYEKHGDAGFNKLPFDIQRVLFCLSKNGDDIYEKKGLKQRKTKLEYFVELDNEIFMKIYNKLQRDTCSLLDRTISKLNTYLLRSSSRTKTTGKNPLSLQQDKLKTFIKELEEIKKEDTVLQCKKVVFAPGEQDYQMRLFHLQDVREKIQEIIARHNLSGGGKHTIRRKCLKRIITRRRRREKK